MNRINLKELKAKKGGSAQFYIPYEDQLKAIEQVKTAIDNLYEFMNEKEDYDYEKLHNQLKLLNDTLDLKPQLEELQKSVKDSKVETVTVKEFGELLKAVKENKPLPVEIDLTRLEKAIIEVQQRIQDASVPDSQGAEDFKPFRRVVKLGNKLVFDDQPTPSKGGGGGRGSLGQLINFDYDYISVAYPNATTEVYTYKTGGSSGSLAGTLTVVYTDDTKENISSVTRS